MISRKSPNESIPLLNGVSGNIMRLVNMVAKRCKVTHTLKIAEFEGKSPTDFCKRRLKMDNLYYETTQLN